MAKEKQLLSFISNEKLFIEVEKVLNIAKEAIDKADEKIHSNVLDPFSAVFDALRQGITLTEWKEQEKARQIQKTIQNTIGAFHQSIIGSVDGWEDLETGSVVDVRNKKKKLLQKLKINTTQLKETIKKKYTTT